MSEMIIWSALPVGAWGDAVGVAEHFREIQGIGITDGFGYFADALCGIFKEITGGIEACTSEILHKSHTCFFFENADKVFG